MKVTCGQALIGARRAAGPVGDGVARRLPRGSPISGSE